MIEAKEVVESGVAFSMAEARRLINNLEVKRVCSRCGACRCTMCMTDRVCRVCGERSTTIHRRGS